MAQFTLMFDRGIYCYMVHSTVMADFSTFNKYVNIPILAFSAQNMSATLWLFAHREKGFFKTNKIFNPIYTKERN